MFALSEKVGVTFSSIFKQQRMVVLGSQACMLDFESIQCDKGCDTI